MPTNNAKPSKSEEKLDPEGSVNAQASSGQSPIPVADKSPRARPDLPISAAKIAALDVLRVDVIKAPKEAKLPFVSLIVSILAIVVAGATSLYAITVSQEAVEVSRRAVEVSKRSQQPVLRVFFNTEPDLGDLGLFVENNGPGTAVLNQTTIHFRKNKYEEFTWEYWEKILGELKIPPDAVTGWQLAGGPNYPDLIRGNDTVKLLVFKKHFDPEVRSKAARELVDAINNDELMIYVAYESLGGDTYETWSTKPWGPRIGDPTRQTGE